MVMRGDLCSLEGKEFVLDEADDCEVVLGGELTLLFVHRCDSSNIPIIQLRSKITHSDSFTQKTRE